MSTDTHARLVNVTETRRLLEEPSSLVLDVRSPGEFETSHIHGAVNIPIDRVDSHLREIVSAAGGTMVLVCQSGGRAEQAAGKLGPAGLDHLVLLEGGMNAWEAAGAPVEHGDTQRWSLERQVRLVAGSIVAGSVLASTAFPKAKWVAAGIGSGLTFAAVSNTCMMGNLLSRLPYNQGPGCDIDLALERLASAG
jgi:rhodanese-related sulfurtransferase